MVWLGASGPNRVRTERRQTWPKLEHRQTTEAGSLQALEVVLGRFRRSRKTSNRGDRFEALRKHQLFDAFCDHFVEPLSQVQLASQVRDGCYFPDGDQRIELAKSSAGPLFFGLHRSGALLGSISSSRTVVM